MSQQNNNNTAEKIKTQTVVFKNKAHGELLAGAELLASAVASTMGPSGHSVIIDNEFGPPTITKDGVTVARSIVLKNKLRSIGAELLKEVAAKTNDIVGDGTTTATVLGHALLKEGVKQIATGRSSIHLKRGMDDATAVAIKFLKENCIPISCKEDTINVGTISANGDRELGELIADAIQKVGKDGIVTIEPAKSVQTTLDIVEGMQIDKGFISPFFVTNSEKSSCELDNPYIFMTSNKISSISEIMGVLEKILKTDRSLLIIADDVEGDALHTLIVNKMKGVLKVCAIKAPSYGENRADNLSDLSVVVGGEVFGVSSQIAIKNATLEQLGQAKKVVVSRGSCVVVAETSNPNRKEKIADRINSLRTALETDVSLDGLRVSKYRERLARLSGGIAVIRVGGSTEVEIKEKKDRVEDAVNATIAAAREGIVPGGGTALFYTSQVLRSMIRSGQFSDSATSHKDDYMAGVKIIADICEYPLKTIVKNTGESAEVVANALMENYKTNPDFRLGYNAAKGTYVDLITDGILDPVLVTRLSLENAVSIIGLTLTCDAVVVDDEE